MEARDRVGCVRENRDIINPAGHHRHRRNIRIFKNRARRTKCAYTMTYFPSHGAIPERTPNRQALGIVDLNLYSYSSTNLELPHLHVGQSVQLLQERLPEIVEGNLFVPQGYQCGLAETRRNKHRGRGDEKEKRGWSNRQHRQLTPRTVA